MFHCICLFMNLTFICCASMGEMNNNFFVLKTLSSLWCKAIIMQSVLFFLLLVSPAPSLFSFSNKKNFFPTHNEFLPLWQFTIPIKKECVLLKQHISFLNLKTIYSDLNTILLLQEYSSPYRYNILPWQLCSLPRQRHISIWRYYFSPRQEIESPR